MIRRQRETVQTALPGQLPMVAVAPLQISQLKKMCSTYRGPHQIDLLDYMLAIPLSAHRLDGQACVFCHCLILSHLLPHVRLMYARPCWRMTEHVFQRLPVLSGNELPHDPVTGTWNTLFSPEECIWISKGDWKAKADGPDRPASSASSGSSSYN